MGTTTHQILLRQNGELSTSPRDPYAIYEPGMVDLKETVSCCLNSGDWRLVSTKLWEVRKITLPDWLPPQEWLRNTTHWKWVWGCGADPAWPETWQRALAYGGFSCEARLACVKLLKTKTFRSEFRASLRRQLVTWIEHPEDREYDSPFSRRQWDALINGHLAREADQIDRYLYRNREACGCPV